MFDDGSGSVIFPPSLTSGDAFKGDGVFTLTVQLPPSTTPGSYRFDFYARDVSGAVSGVLSHTVEVVP